MEKPQIIPKLMSDMGLNRTSEKFLDHIYIWLEKKSGVVGSL